MARTSFAQQQIPPRGRDAVPYPDWRQFINGVMLRGAEAMAGTVLGTGALINVLTPFDPGYVVLLKPAGTGAPIQMHKHPGQTTDNTLKTIAAGTVTVVAAGVTLGTGQFSIGTDAGINEVAQPILWRAFGFSSTGGL
jgi:hypothetical protein